MANLALKQQTDGSWLIQGALTRETVGDESLINQVLKNAQSETYFDLSSVSRVDTAGLAWLIHALSQLKSQGKRLELNKTPEQLTNLMALGQVTSIFE